MIDNRTSLTKEFFFSYRRLLTSVWEIARDMLSRKLRTTTGDCWQKYVRRQTGDFVKNPKRHVQRESCEIRWLVFTNHYVYDQYVFFKNILVDLRIRI